MVKSQGTYKFKKNVSSIFKQKSIDENNEPEKQPIQIEERSIADNKTELISSSIQKIILDNIAKYNLYSFGKHITVAMIQSVWVWWI